MKTKTNANFRYYKKPNVILRVLPKGTPVETTPEKRSMLGFNFVSCKVDGIFGWIAEHLLVQEDNYIYHEREDFEAEMQSLKGNPKTPNDIRARLYPIERMPCQTDFEKHFEEVVRFLDVENSLAFRAKGAKTYCNVAAYQFCHQMGVYIPRVFWSRSAFAKIAAGEKVPVEYGKTVFEMSANALFDWFFEFGEKNGWKQVDFDNLPKNKIILAIVKREEIGHIAIIKPNGNSWEAGRSNKEDNPDWRKWFFSKKNIGRAIFVK